jgi:hypothetical protein
MDRKTKKMLISKIRNISMKFMSFYQGANFNNSGHIMLYPQVSCAYNRIKKSANSSTLMFIADRLKVNGLNNETSIATNDYSHYKNKSIQSGVSLSKIWRPQDLKKLEEYFWFTVVRNPYSRLLSAYLQKGQEKERGHIKFIDYPGLAKLNPTGFKEFVAFLQDNGINKNQHWWPQTDLLFMPANHFDFIAKTENLEQDLEYVFQQVGLNKNHNLSLSKPHVAETSLNWKITNANNKLRQFYDDKTTEIVYELYQSDFINFKYASDLILKPKN